MAITTSTVQQNMTTDGDTTDYLSMKGACTLYAAGTFDGGTVTFYISYDGGTTWLECKDLTSVTIAFASNGALDFTSFGGGLIKATLSSAGASTDLDVRMIQ